MCIIAFTPAFASRPTLDTLQNCFDYNDDGAGYAIATGQRLIVRKPFWTWSDFSAAYSEDAQRYPTHAMLVHFRIATHGRLSIRNCHPHSLCAGDIALAHNGILPREFHPAGKEVSDTVMLCKMLDRSDATTLLSRRIRKRLARAIGQANKLVMLASSGRFSIVNERQGNWNGGTWYSNYSYQYCKQSDCRYQTIGQHDSLTWSDEDDVEAIWDSMCDGTIEWSDVRAMLNDKTIKASTYARLMHRLLDKDYNGHIA